MTPEQLSQLFSSMDGQVERGGCDQCEATHSYRVDINADCVVQVSHGDDCPVLARKRRP